MAYLQLSNYCPTTGFSLNEQEIDELYDIVGNELIRRDGTRSMLANLSMNNYNINGLLDPIQPNDAATKAYTDSKANVSGQIFTGNIGMNQNWINNIGNAIQNYDAINKITNDTLLNTKANISGQIFTGNIGMNQNFINNVGNAIQNYDAINKITNDTLLNGKLSLTGGTMVGTLTMNSQVIKGNPGIIVQGTSVGEGLVNFYNSAHGVGRVGTSADIYLYTTSGSLALSTNGTTRNQFTMIGTSCSMNMNLDMVGRIISNMAYINMGANPIITGTSTTSVIIMGTSAANGGIGLGNQNHGIIRGSITPGSNNDIVVYTAGTGSKIVLSPNGNSTSYFELSTTLLNCKVIVDMYNNRISNVATPTAANDSTNKSYVDGQLTSLINANIATINSQIANLVPYSGATTSVNLNNKAITNVSSVTVNQALGLTAYSPLVEPNSSLYLQGVSKKLRYINDSGVGGNVIVDDNNENIIMSNLKYLQTNIIKSLPGSTALTLKDDGSNPLLSFNTFGNIQTNYCTISMPILMPAFALETGYAYVATIDSSNTTGPIDRTTNIIEITTTTASKFLSLITYNGVLLPYHRIVLKNKTSYNITLGHKSVTTAGYILGLFTQVTPNEHVELFYDSTNTCFVLLNRNTNIFDWGLVPVREAEFKGFCHNNGSGVLAGINCNNSTTPINSVTFSTWTSATTTGTNWSVSVSGSLLSVASDGNMSSGDTELYKTRYFNYNFTSATITFSNLTKNNYYVACFLSNDFDNTTIRTAQLDMGITNKRISYNYQNFYTGMGYTNPGVIAYLPFRAVNSTTAVFVITNVANFHIYAVWLLSLGTSI